MNTSRNKPARPRVNRQDPIARGLVVAMPFVDAEPSVVTNLADRSKNGVPTSFTASDVWDQGTLGKQLRIGSTTGYIAIPHIVTPYVTISCIFKRIVLDTGLNQLVARDDGTGSTRIWQFRITGSNTIQFIPFNQTPANGSITGGTAIALDKWYHVIATYDGARSRLYVNGKEDAAADTSLTGPLNNRTRQIEISRDRPIDLNYFNGAYADVRIWDRAITQSEAAALYADPWKMYRPAKRRAAAKAPAGGVTGTGAVTTATTTASGAGRVIHKATGTPGVTTATVTAIGAGAIDHNGTGAATTSNVTASGAGLLEHSGSGSVTTGVATASGAGKVVHPGSGSVTTGSTTASGAGRLVHVTTGTPGVTTGSVTASGTGLTIGTQTGTGSVTTGAVTAEGAGRVVHRGAGGVTTGAVTAEGVGVGPGGVSGAGSGRRKAPKPRRPLKEAAPPVKLKIRRPRFILERPPQAPQPVPAFDFEADDEAAMIAILEAVL